MLACKTNQKAGIGGTQGNRKVPQKPQNPQTYQDRVPSGPYNGLKIDGYTHRECGLLPTLEVAIMPAKLDHRKLSDSGVESPTRTRRSTEGDLSATSTPELRPRTELINLKPRSESSLLRIRAQLRAAAEVSMEQSVRQVDEPKEEKREAESSFVSDISAVGGGALHEMPRLANALL
ncbi:jg26940 [Pararge aegeria aegeria]|uniref:Jg26940 protein n=1 Tax=Pararge aegeria aegeria TaxID=348720 RepID=A0A8S4QV04_9NEOP|nr:jg26940 [Pararge aegeria aegeria]